MANSETNDQSSTESLAHNGAYVLLCVGQFISQMGDRLVMVALPWLIHQRTGSVLGTGAVLAIYTAPYVLLGPLAGVLVDRWNKRLVLILADLIRAGTVLLIPIAATRSVACVFMLAFAMAGAAVFFDPSKLAILPEIVTKKALLRANSVLAVAENVTEVLGYGAAGLLLAHVSIPMAFHIDGLTFGASALALLLMPYTAHRRVLGPQRGRSIRRELRQGLQFLKRHRGLRANTVITIAAAAGSGATYPLTFFLAIQVFEGGTVAFGLLEAALSIGYLAGSIAIAALAGRLRKGITMMLGFGLTGVCLVTVAATPTVWAATLPFLAAGAANAGALLAVDTYVQEVTPEPLRGRIWGTRFTLTQGTYAASVLAGAALVGTLDVRVLFIVAGAVVAVSAAAGLFIREIREA